MCFYLHIFSAEIQAHRAAQYNNLGFCELFEKFEKKYRTLLATPGIDISESRTLRLNVCSWIRHTSADALAAFDEGEEMTKALRRASQIKHSVLYFIDQSMEIDKTKDTAAELKRLPEWKPIRLIQRINVTVTKRFRLDKAKMRGTWT